MMFETVLEPVILRSKPDENAGRAAVTRDDDLLVSSQAQVLRQVVFDLSQRYRPELASLPRRATLAPRLW